MLMLRLAAADARYEARAFLCHAVALAAVLAPLLVLLGLRHGVIGSLRADLLEDPRNLEIVVVGNRAYTPDWMAALAERPEVGFLVPRTRSIAASLHVRLPDDRAVTLAELVPTAAGDPLLAPGFRPADDAVVLTHELATALGVKAGDALVGVAARQIDGRGERAELPLTVALVLPPERLDRRRALLPLGVLAALERWRDGAAVERFAGPPADPERSYASFRLYARGLDDVAPLVDHLSALGVETRSRLADIQALRRLDAALGHVFTLIAATGGLGYLLSLAVTLWANVERRGRDLSVVRLLGVPAAAVIGYPVAQALFIAGGGIAVALLLYAAAEASINAGFSGLAAAGRPICALSAGHMAAAAAVTLLAALAASAAAGWRAGRIEPAEGMRHA